VVPHTNNKLVVSGHSENSIGLTFWFMFLYDPKNRSSYSVCSYRSLSPKSVVISQVYTGVLRLGQATSSYDAETAPTEERPWRHLSDADLTAAAAAMTGDLMQMPPMFSAIKVKGADRQDAACRVMRSVHSCRGPCRTTGLTYRYGCMDT